MALLQPLSLPWLLWLRIASVCPGSLGLACLPPLLSAQFFPSLAGYHASPNPAQDRAYQLFLSSVSLV